MTTEQDEARLADIDAQMAVYRGARDRGFANAGPGVDTFTYWDMELVRGLLAAAKGAGGTRRTGDAG